MIQRKQTLFLLAVAIISVLMFFIPFQSYPHTGFDWIWTLMPFLSPSAANSNIMFPIILNIIVILLSLFTIFKFKNRPLQYKLSNLLILLNVFIIGLFFLLPFVDITHTNNVAPKITYKIGAFLPILGAGFAFLAAHFIKKDEQLVRSADRIR